MKKVKGKKTINDEAVSREELALVSEYIKLRCASKMSQRDIGKKTGLAQSTVARMEKNLHSVTLSNFIKILNSLGYHLEIKKTRKSRKIQTNNNVK